LLRALSGEIARRRQAFRSTPLKGWPAEATERLRDDSMQDANEPALEPGLQLPQITYFLFVTYDATLYPLHHIEECRQRELVENSQLNLIVKTSARVHDQQKHSKLIEQLLLETPDWTPQNSFVFTLIRDGNVNEYKGP
jgi:hypothetical protein